jgi:hypothetical protein
MKTVASRRFDKQIRMVLLSLLVNSFPVIAVACKPWRVPVSRNPHVCCEIKSPAMFPNSALDDGKYRRAGIVSQRKAAYRRCILRSHG